MILQSLDIKKGDWTLFIDRDGVINRRLVDDYVKNLDEFEFLPGVLHAMSIFAKNFKHIFVVTNQQGVGKGLMTEEKVHQIHSSMVSQIVQKNGRIDAVYFCPDLANSGSLNRKPEIGMALQAQQEFPSVEFSKSIMIGDSISDMKFGKTAGMITVFITSTPNFESTFVDYTAVSLEEFASEIS